MKKHIRVKFIDKGNVRNDILPLLQKYYEVELTDTPDFAFFDYQQRDQAVYYDCVRVLFIGENCRPDFNLFDYCIGFDDLTFGDRFLKFPVYAWSYYRKQLEEALVKHEKLKRDFPKKTEFCGFVVSNGSEANSIREKMFYRISEYKQVDSAGGYLNNMPDGKRIDDKALPDFYRRHKFMLAFENSCCKGYTTEKIIRAWAGETIPIYWGDPDIGAVFNDKAFIWLKDTTDEAIEDVIRQIKELDEDENLYRDMLMQPILRDSDVVPDFMKESSLEHFLCSILDQSPGSAIRRTNAKDGWGKFYERDYKRYVDISGSRLLSRLYRLMKLLKIK